MAIYELEILAKDEKTWNTLKMSDFDDDLAKLKKAKEKFYQTVFFDRQMRITKTVTEDGRVVQTVVG